MVVYKSSGTKSYFCFSLASRPGGGMTPMRPSKRDNSALWISTTSFTTKYLTRFQSTKDQLVSMAPRLWVRTLQVHFYIILFVTFSRDVP